MNYVPLYVYSAYSLLKSTLSVQRLVQVAKQRGCTHLALTDEYMLHGAYNFYKECKKHSIHPIIGITARLRFHDTFFTFHFYVQNEDGYKNIVKLSSAMGLREQHYVTIQDVIRFSNGLTCVVSPFQLEEEEEIKQHRTDLIQQLQPYFSHFYYGVAPLLTDEQYEQLQLMFNTIGLRPVAMPYICMGNSEEREAFFCLKGIRTGVTYEKAFPKLNIPQHFLTSEEAHEYYEQRLQCLQNTYEIAKQCQFQWEKKRVTIPTYPFLEGKTGDEKLRQLVEIGLQERYSIVTEEIKDRAAYELAIIEKMGFAHYFLYVWDFMNFAREKGILTGPGRGSAAGSLIAYALYITQVDPLQYGLLFERFLNPERVTMPDIDIDFPDHRREEVLQYVRERFGRLHVSQIVTYGTLGAKASIRDVGRVLKLPQREIDELSRVIPTRPGITLAQAKEESVALKNMLAHHDKFQRVIQLAEKIEGLPRHTSIHAAGVIISDTPLIERVPVMEGTHGEILTQYDGETVEEIGLLKMDFLGLRNLTLLESMVRDIRRIQSDFSLYSIPLQDDDTFQLLAEGDTAGIFQLESEGMQRVLQQLKPTQFEDIVAVNALYRPGPMEHIPEFIRRKHGEERITYPHDSIQPILQRTYGVLVYQEQILQVASTMAGYSFGRADVLRRAISKKDRNTLLKEKEEFLAGCKQKGYATETAEEVFSWIVAFANYGFNRSHAVAYSLISYWLSYIKCHFPIVFYSQVLSSIAGDKKLSTFILEAKEKGLQILAPHINESVLYFKGSERGIYVSFPTIKGIAYAIGNEIVKTRKVKGDFTDFFDFVVKMPRKHCTEKLLQTLIFSGCFDHFGQNRPTLVATIDAALQFRDLVCGDDDTSDVIDQEFMFKPAYVQKEDFSLQEKLKLEKEWLGFYLSAHPSESVRDMLVPFRPVRVHKVKQLKEGTTCYIVATLSDIKLLRTKKHEDMISFSIHDESGDIPSVCFPKEYTTLKDKIYDGALLLLNGKLSKNRGRLQFVVNDVKNDKEWEQFLSSTDRLFIKINTIQNKSMIKSVSQLLREYRGNTPIYLYYEEEKTYRELPVTYWTSLHPKLFERLHQLIGEENVVLKKIDS